MIILKMNRLIERHGKLALVIIALAVVIPFVFMWGPHSVFDGTARRREVRNAGTMFGEPIEFPVLIRQLRFIQLQLLQSQGRLVQINRGEEGQMILDQAIQRLRLLREARRHNLQPVAEAQIDEWASRPFRTETGGFDREAYDSFSRQWLPHLGLSESDYRDFIRESIVINRLSEIATAGVFVSPLEVEAQLRRDHEQFRLLYRGFDRGDFREAAAAALVPDSRVRQYFDANRGSELGEGMVITELDEATKTAIREHLLIDVGREFYQREIAFIKPHLAETGDLDAALARYQRQYRESTAPAEAGFPFTPAEAEVRVDRYVRAIYQPVRKKLRLAIFDTPFFLDQVEVTEADLRAAYQRESDRYAPRVRARHILLRADEEDPEADREIREKLELLRERIADGEDFAELAREYSEDPGSAPRGGDLGSFRRDQMVAPFAEAAFALDPGETSEVVETRFGYHLIQVEETIPRRELDEVREELRDQIGMAQARSKAWAAADAFAYAVFDRSADFDLETAAGRQRQAEIFLELAQQREVRSQDTEFFNLRQLPPVFRGHRQAAEKAYRTNSEQPLSDVIEGDERYFVAYFLDSAPAQIPEFAADPEIQQRCVNWARQGKELELARQTAADIHREISEELETAAETIEILKAKFDFAETAPFTRRSPPAQAAEYQWVIIDHLDDLEVATLASPVETRYGALLLWLAERIPADLEELEEEREQTRSRLLNRKADWAIRSFVEDVETRSQTTLADNLLSYLSR